jgi:hypothetical protein
MRFTPAIIGLSFYVLLGKPALAQDRPRLHRLDRFMVKGAFAELDEELLKHRLSLRDIEKDHLDGKPAEITDLLRLMARYEELKPQVEEPLLVTGKISVSLPPNARGDEAYTTCFSALTYNGLAFSGIEDALVLVRAEKHPKVEQPKRRWNRDRILAAQLFHLGYLNSNPIMRRYHDALGTGEGHLVLIPRSNVLIAVDTEPALERLGALIDAEIVESMGVSASSGRALKAEARPPSPGAVASRQAIVFYLMAYARLQHIPLVADEQKGVYSRRYAEADLWTSETGYRALQAEYRRINDYARSLRESGAEDWAVTDPDRVLSLEQQKKLEIRFGLAAPPSGRGSVPASKKSPRRRR